MKPTFYLDLDRTLFHTEHIGELFPVLERIYPDNAALRGGYERREEYFVFPHLDDGDTKTYYYDLAGQLRAAGLSPDSALCAAHSPDAGRRAPIAWRRQPDGHLPGELPRTPRGH